MCIKALIWIDLSILRSRIKFLKSHRQDANMMIQYLILLIVKKISLLKVNRLQMSNSLMMIHLLPIPWMEEMDRSEALALMVLKMREQLNNYSVNMRNSSRKV
jgi:hypothetical protein